MTVTHVLNIGTRVTLTTEEVQWCYIVGCRRMHNNRQAHVVDRRYSKASGEVIDISGVIGEYALAKMLDLVPYLEIDAAAQNKCAANDVGHDLLDCIDVKTVRNVRGDTGRHLPLLVTAKKQINPAPWYVQMSIQGCLDSYSLPQYGLPVDVVFEGCVPHSVVFAQQHQCKTGRYEVPHNLFKSLSLFTERFQQHRPPYPHQSLFGEATIT